MPGLYDPRNKVNQETRDNDLFFWDGAGASWTWGPTISSTVSSVSDIVDLGAAQVFNNIPVQIRFEATASVSCLSVHSSGLTALKCAIPGIFVQDAADGSTFSSIGFVIAPADASLGISVAGWNSMIYGVVGCRRYLRLFQSIGVGTSGTIRAWARMGMQRQI